MVNWTADKDQVILKGIFKFHDIKSSAPLLKYLSDEIGGDCTPKAVSHRLSNIRKGGSTRPTGSATSTPAKPSPASASKTPRSRAKATPRRKKHDVSEEEGPEGLVDDDQDILDSPSAARGKRTLNGSRKTNYAEPVTDDEEVPDYAPAASKRVKKEPVDEETVLEDEFNEEV